MKEFLPEWTPCEGVLMALPNENTDWEYILDEAIAQYNRLISAFTNEGVHVVLICDIAEKSASLLKDCNPSYITFIEADFNDTWTRDYGPLTILKHGDLRGLDFGFNGWGLKFAAHKDNLVNRQLNEKMVFYKNNYRNESSFILEGGSIETDGEGTILTTTRCLCSPNRNGGLTKHEADTQLRKRLGAQHILFLDYGALAGDDTDSHIDTLARLAPNNTILFTGCRDVDDSHFEELLKMRAQLSMFRNAVGDPYNLIELPLPQAIFDENGERLPATYANYLIYNDLIFMPTYNQTDNDMLAQQTLRIAFPNHKIVGIDCTTLIKQHGSLHCATMQLPVGLFTPVIFDNQKL